MNWIDDKKRLRIYERDNYACRYCGRSLSKKDGTLSIDHIKARSKGGTNEECNLVTSCAQCQWKKMAKSVEESGMCLLPIRGGRLNG